jgi:FKBP-type peptidyl-prolyl cis-trans isomerase 2
MAQANSGDTVRIGYTGKLTDGTVFDSSEGRDPLEFVIGENTIIPTLEAACVGMAIGEKATVDVSADNAYGPHHPDRRTLDDPAGGRPDHRRPASGDCARRTDSCSDHRRGRG